jgi:periplasmic copper chaperone A
MKHLMTSAAFAFAAWSCAAGAQQPAAPVEVRDAWVRQTVPGQSGTGAFMKLTAPAGARLIGAQTPVAGVAEVHEMKMEGDVMKMRALQGGLELPAGRTVELKPSGYHVMLMNLKQPIAKGATVPMTLRFEDARGVQSTLELNLPVGAPVAAAADGGGHKH